MKTKRNTSRSGSTSRKGRIFPCSTCSTLTTSSTSGFTFIELLAVMIVLGAIGTIIGAILFTSLRGNNKANAIAAVRQDGNNALFLMAKMIRGARSFDGVSIDNTTYTVNCIQPTPPPLTPTPTPLQYKFLRITSFDDKQTTFACCSGSPSFIASGSATGVSACSSSVYNTPLIDTTAVSMDVSRCMFTCSQISEANIPTLQIHFELDANNGNLTPLPEKTAGKTPIPFDTSVTFRNLIR